MSQVRRLFISYSSRDRERVNVLVQVLEAAGFAVWYDQKLQAGQNWWQEILKQIRDCDLVVVAVSETMLDSKPCYLEREYAQKLGKGQVPVIITDGFDPARLPQDLSVIHFRSFTTKNDESSQIIRDIRDHDPAPSLPDPLPAAPDAPVHPLAIVNQILTAPNINSDEQRNIADSLDWYLRGQRNPQEKQQALDLLGKLRDHDDVTALVKRRSEEILNRVQMRRLLLPVGVIGTVIIVLIALALLTSSFNLLVASPTATSTDTPTYTLTATVTETMIPPSETPTSSPTAEPADTPVPSATPVPPDLALTWRDTTFVLVNISANPLPADLISALNFMEQDQVRYTGENWPRISEFENLAPGQCLVIWTETYPEEQTVRDIAADCSEEILVWDALEADLRFWTGDDDAPTFTLELGERSLITCETEARSCRVTLPQN